MILMRHMAIMLNYNIENIISKHSGRFVIHSSYKIYKCHYKITTMYNIGQNHQFLKKERKQLNSVQNVQRNLSESQWYLLHWAT